MSIEGEVVVGLVMLVGLLGIVVPVLPGLLLVWGAALVWALVEDGTGRWLVLALVTALCLLGAVAAYVVPGRSLQAQGAPTRTLLVGALGAAIGFVTVPGVGLLLGGVLAVYGAELLRLRDSSAARTSTWATVKGIGLGIVLQLLAGSLAVAVWLIGAVITA